MFIIYSILDLDALQIPQITCKLGLKMDLASWIHFSHFSPVLAVFNFRLLDCWRTMRRSSQTRRCRPVRTTQRSRRLRRWDDAPLPLLQRFKWRKFLIIDTSGSVQQLHRHWAPVGFILHLQLFRGEFTVACLQRGTLYSATTSIFYRSLTGQPEPRRSWTCLPNQLL